MIRKFVMISIHAGASGLSIFMAMNLPGEEVYSGFDRLPRSKSHPEDGIYSGLIPLRSLLLSEKESSEKPSSASVESKTLFSLN